MTNKVNKKIRVISSNLYTIEVNEEGETIALDLTDLNLFTNLKSTFTRLDTLGNNFTKGMQKIEKVDESKMHDNYTTEKENQQIELLNQFYQDSRQTLDGFLGEGACQKIFGNHNFITMFDDLAKALEPCFMDMRKKIMKSQQELRRNYAQKDSKKQVKL